MGAKANHLIDNAAGNLRSEKLETMEGEPGPQQPILFVGTFRQLEERLPTLATQSDIDDITESYPPAGEYVIRYVANPTPPVKPKEEPIVAAESLLIIAGDAAGADKAIANLLNVLTYPRHLYSQWLPAHWSVK